MGKNKIAFYVSFLKRLFPYDIKLYKNISAM